MTAIAGLIAALHGAGIIPFASSPQIEFETVTKLCPEMAPYCTYIDSPDNVMKAAILEEKCRLWAEHRGWRFDRYTSVNGKPACVVGIPRESRC
jgi:hypothetical protein